MGSDVTDFFPTASLHRDHSILYALVCEKEISHIDKNNGNPDRVFEKFLSHKPVPAQGKDKKNKQPHAGRTSIRDVIEMLT